MNLNKKIRFPLSAVVASSVLASIAPAQNPHRKMHHLLPMQAAAYQNGLWIVATAKAGMEGGCLMMGHSCVIAPSGEVVAISGSLDDEVLPYRIDLDATAEYKRVLDPDRRRPDSYGAIAGSPLPPSPESP